MEKTMAMGNACFFALAMNAARPFGLQKDKGRRKKEEGRRKERRWKKVIMNAGIFTEYEIHRLVTETLPSHPPFPRRILRRTASSY